MSVAFTHHTDGEVMGGAALTHPTGSWWKIATALNPPRAPPEWPGGGRARVEHWRVAQQHARLAARNIAGAGGVYDGVPFFWTYHYEKRFEYLGHADAWEQELVEGDVERQDFVMLLVRSGLVAAVVACGCHFLPNACNAFGFGIARFL